MQTDNNRKHFRLGLPGWIFIGAVAGIAVGVIFGKRCTALEPIASAYVMLLQSVVYPYIMCTLLHGLGQLDPGRAKRLFRSGWHFMLLVWVLTFGTMLLLSQIVPAPPPPSVLDATNPVRLESGLLQLLIPANISADLVGNYIPAVVVFCILFGIALQRFPKRDELLNVLAIIRGAGIVIWRWIVYMAPIAVFAMFARTAGSIDPAQLHNLLFYLALYLGGAFLLAFVILPLLMSALIPRGYREIMSILREAFVLAAVTTISAVALPYVLDATRKLASECDITDKDRDDIIQTTLSISYPLAQLGNFFVYLFILFSAYYYRVPLDGAKTVLLPLMTLLSCIGSPTSSVNAVGFLGKWLQFPSELSAFYIETMTVTRYGQVIVSVMGFAFVTMTVTLAYYGKLRLNLRRLLSAAGLSMVTLLAFAAIMYPLHSTDLPQHSYLNLTLAPETTADITATIHTNYPTRQKTDNASEGSTLHRIQRTQTLRVGYNPNIIPFCYRNSDGDLVGYDIAHAYALARALNTRLEFIPFEWDTLLRDLDEHRFDIAMAGIYATSERLRRVEVSSVYYQSPLALIVPTKQAHDFLHMEDIHKRPQLRIAIFNDPVLEPAAKRLFPQAEMVVCHDYNQLPDLANIDAALWTLEQARIWAGEHAGYTAVRPAGLTGVEVFAYLMPPDSPELVRFVNRWLQLMQAQRFSEQCKTYWIDGHKRP